MSMHALLTIQYETAGLNRRLAKAVHDDDHEQVSALLAQPGADPNTWYWKGGHCLLYSADPESARILLQHPAIDPNRRFCSGSQTPLETAYANGHLELLLVLLSHPRTDPNVLNCSSRVLLADNGPDLDVRLQMIKVLLAHAAIDPNRFSHPSDVHGDAIGPPLLFVDSEAVARLVMRHPRTDVNIALDLKYQDVHCACLVHWACARGEEWRLAVLLAHPRVDLTVTNRQGQDAWDICRAKDAQGCLHLLESHRAGSTSMQGLLQRVKQMGLHVQLTNKTQHAYFAFCILRHLVAAHWRWFRAPTISAKDIPAIARSVPSSSAPKAGLPLSFQQQG